MKCWVFEARRLCNARFRLRPFHFHCIWRSRRNM